MKACLLLATLAVGAAACSDTGGVNPDAIDGQEIAAVRTALDSALKNDSSYLILRLFVFQYVDRATRQAEANGDTSRLVGVQVDVNAVRADTPVVAQLSAALRWRGYKAATHTVDTVVFVVGAGITPPAVTIALRERFSPDTLGTGTGFIIHQNADASIQAWQARSGTLHVTASAYGKGITQSGGGLTLTAYRGTTSGDYTMMGKLMTDTTNVATSAATFPAGIQALKVKLTGTTP